MEWDKENFAESIFEYVDQLKDLFSPEAWQNMLLDCTKNELFILWLLFRQREANMTQVAECIHVPLNTATGVIARMEKRQLVIRNRSEEDKRIVTIQLGARGQEQIQSILREILYYGQQIMEEFTPEESSLLIKCLAKVKKVLSQERKSQEQERKVKKIKIE